MKVERKLCKGISAYYDYSKGVLLRQDCSEELIKYTKRKTCIMEVWISRTYSNPMFHLHPELTEKKKDSPGIAKDTPGNIELWIASRLSSSEEEAPSENYHVLDSTMTSPCNPSTPSVTNDCGTSQEMPFCTIALQLPDNALPSSSQEVDEATPLPLSSPEVDDDDEEVQMITCATHRSSDSSLIYPEDGGARMTVVAQPQGTLSQVSVKDQSRSQVERVQKVEGCDSVCSESSIVQTLKRWIPAVTVICLSIVHIILGPLVLDKLSSFSFTCNNERNTVKF